MLDLKEKSVLINEDDIRNRVAEHLDFPLMELA